MGYQPWTDLVKIRRAICMQIPTLFWKCERITCFNYWMYFGLMLLTRIKYIELGDCVLRLRWLLKCWEDIDNQVLIKLQKNLIQAGGGSVRSEIHKIINSFTNKEELRKQSKLFAHSKCDTPDCSYCYSISLLSTAHKI